MGSASLYHHEGAQPKPTSQTGLAACREVKETCASENNLSLFLVCAVDGALAPHLHGQQSPSWPCHLTSLPFCLRWRNRDSDWGMNLPRSHSPLVGELSLELAFFHQVSASVISPGCHLSLPPLQQCPQSQTQWFLGLGEPWGNQEGWRKIRKMRDELGQQRQGPLAVNRGHAPWRERSAAAPSAHPDTGEAKPGAPHSQRSTGQGMCSLHTT